MFCIITITAIMYYPLRTMCEVETMARVIPASKKLLFFLLTINIIEFSITYNDNLIKRSTEVNLLRIVSKATLWQNQFWWIKIKFWDFFETETEFVFISQGYKDPFVMIFLWGKEQEQVVNLQQWRWINWIMAYQICCWHKFSLNIIACVLLKEFQFNNTYWP